MDVVGSTELLLDGRTEEVVLGIELLLEGVVIRLVVALVAGIEEDEDDDSNNDDDVVVVGVTGTTTVVLVVKVVFKAEIVVLMLSVVLELSDCADIVHANAKKARK